MPAPSKDRYLRCTNPDCDFGTAHVSKFDQTGMKRACPLCGGATALSPDQSGGDDSGT